LAAYWFNRFRYLENSIFNYFNFGGLVVWGYSAITSPKNFDYSNLFINTFLQPEIALRFRMYLINNYFLFRVVTFLAVYTYTLSLQEAHCEAEVILKVIKKINLQKVHPDHYLLLKRPVLILPETAYFPRGSFMPLGRTCFMQAQLLGNQTLAGQYTTQYISLFPYLSKSNLFEFGELGNEYAHKYLYHDEFIKIYRKYESLDEWENHDFFFINPQKSIRANLNTKLK